ncbi:MAG: bifunctional diaminohydroxyphosphoribosylaminopyrimidine deaminase/5-amino-6-(5-phosphoribosylamino)uracil reductase RibD [Flavobacteriales bacterium]|nr:bifunctional diaminohydroxyphosphoribosylaminopyrimidine deaminase/5-amino-6-(5-phosphoribosylamino)uracil reductase RibD [Flavobacteriales bacterium]
MGTHEHWMRRCLQLARLGAGSAAPNPMVGAVLVHEGRVLAEGWHRTPGTAHAERACLDSINSMDVPGDAVMHLNLEPCAHQGRTPPCADLLIARGVRRVVIAHRDPFAEVNGKGIARLIAAGTEVTEGVLADEARWMNRRFITSIIEARPYVILKWAQSRDGFIDRSPRMQRGSQRISSPETDALVHRWRSEEQAILVGSRTVVNDDPRLDVRHVDGRQPLRVVLDRCGAAPLGSNVFEGTNSTLLFTAKERAGIAAEQVVVQDHEDPIDRMLGELHARAVRSVLIEGGAELLGHFMRRGLWDEARVITGDIVLGHGTAAPEPPAAAVRSIEHGTDRIDLLINRDRRAVPDAAWLW